MLTFYKYLSSGGNATPNICNYRTNVQLAKKNICCNKPQTKNSGGTSELQAGFQMLWIYFHNLEGMYAAQKWEIIFVCRVQIKFIRSYLYKNTLKKTTSTSC